MIATGGKSAQKQTERKMPGGSNLRPPTLAVGGQILTIKLCKSMMGDVILGNIVARSSMNS